MKNVEGRGKVRKCQRKSEIVRKCRRKSKKLIEVQKLERVKKSRRNTKSE